MSVAVWPTSPRLPPRLLPDMGFSARYPNRLVSRSYSTDQSVMSRTVSNSTTSYPSMGFVPLQGFTSLRRNSPAYLAVGFQRPATRFNAAGRTCSQPGEVASSLSNRTKHTLIRLLQSLPLLPLKNREIRFSIFLRQSAVRTYTKNKGQIEVCPKEKLGTNTVSPRNNSIRRWLCP